jgi:spermidine synthase
MNRPETALPRGSQTETCRPSSSARGRPPEYLVVLSLLAFSFMLFQMSVLREIRYTLSTLFTLTPFLFSTVILFIGLGAVAARQASSTAAVLRWSVAALPVLLLPLFALTVALSQSTMDHTADLFAQVPTLEGQVRTDANYIGAVARAFITVAVFGYGSVFVLQGLIFALYFREGRDEGTLSRLYAVDLIASGVAALSGGVLASYVTPVGSVLLAVGALVVTLWLARRYLGLSPPLALAVTLTALAMIAGEWATGTVGRLETPRWLPGNLVFSIWTPYRRIDVTERGDTLTVHTDGLPVQFHEKNERLHQGDPRLLQALLAEHDGGVKTVLVIGSGSGADIRVLRHRVARALQITAVEMEGGYVRAARAFPWLWESYRTARITVEEGRYFLEKNRQTFDMVIYAYIDPQSGISKLGIPDANFLYTDAGIRRAYSRLRAGGYFVLNRVYLVDQAPEFFSQLCATLQSAGMDRSEVSLYTSAESGNWGSFGQVGTATVLVRKGGPAPGLRHPLIVPVAWIDGGRPTTDFYPFSLVTDAWFGTLWDYVKSRVVLAALLAILAALLLARIVTSLGHAHFFLLGLASFLVESLVLLNSFLLFGDPSLSAALAVGFFLLWGGIGSACSERLHARRGFYVAVPAVVLLYALTGPLVHAATMGTPVALRGAAFALHVSVVAIAVGATFPLSLRSFSGQAVAPMLFVDLVGCAVAPILFWLLMSSQGIPLVTVVCVASYGAVAAVLGWRR